MIRYGIHTSSDGNDTEMAVTFFNRRIASSCGLNYRVREEIEDMRSRIGFFGIGLVATLTIWPSEGFSQVQAAQNRIPQQVMINGETAAGAYVMTAGGQIQGYTCPSPQRYTTADGSSQGWACYEQTTGVWLLNAVPPAQPQIAAAPQPVPQQPAIAYPQAPPAVVYQQSPPAVVYQQAPPAVVYQQAPPTVIYQQPAAVIY